MGADGGRFTIQELLPASAVYRGGDAARFEWDAQRKSIPVAPWSYGVQLRTVRTDYPGGGAVTEQVLGANFKPFTLQGRWVDKWNVPGYAELTRKQFEALVLRGNLCRFQFRGVTFVGLITDFDCDYKRPQDSKYKFTVSAHGRGETDLVARPRSPRTTLDPKTHQLQLKQRLEELPIANPPPNFGGNPIAREILALAGAFNNAVADVADAVDAAVLAPLGDVAKAMQVLAASFAITRGRAQQLIDKLGAIRSDVAGVQTSFSLATMDAWVRGLVRQARLATDLAYRAEDDVVRRAQPDVLAIHEAKQNESLYGIALRYYGSPDGWRLIAQRNGLESFALQGGELLVIPEGPRR